MCRDKLLIALIPVICNYVARMLSGRISQDIEDTAADATHGLVRWTYHKYPDDAELSTADQKRMTGTARNGTRQEYPYQSG